MHHPKTPSLGHVSQMQSQQVFMYSAHVWAAYPPIESRCWVTDSCCLTDAILRFQCSAVHRFFRTALWANLHVVVTECVNLGLWSGPWASFVFLYQCHSSLHVHCNLWCAPPQGNAFEIRP